MYKLLKSKLHRATVTDADVEYEGSISIDAGLMDAANIREYEEVHVWDVTNGARLTTYAIPDERKGSICINGAAAKLVNKGDTVIIACYAYYDDQDAAEHEATKLFLDEANNVKTS